jgi:hypothetical protein
MLGLYVQHFAVLSCMPTVILMSVNNPIILFGPGGMEFSGLIVVQ